MLETLKLSKTLKSSRDDFNVLDNFNLSSIKTANLLTSSCELNFRQWRQAVVNTNNRYLGLIFQPNFVQLRRVCVMRKLNYPSQFLHFFFLPFCMQAKFWERSILSQILADLKSPTAKIDLIDFLQLEPAFLKANYVTFSYLPKPIDGQNMSEKIPFWPLVAEFLSEFTLPSGTFVDATRKSAWKLVLKPASLRFRYLS